MYVFSIKYYFIMGIIDRFYDWLYNVECYYNENCIYESVREISLIKYWIRKCVCCRKLFEKEVIYYFNIDIRKEMKCGCGGFWYELLWIKYDGLNFLNLVG